MGDGLYGSESGVTWYSTINNRFEILNSSGQPRAVPSDTTTVALSSAAESAIQWAIRKQAEEADLAKLCAQHPGLKDAKEKFDIMRALVSHQ
jgi:hypothetical protein